MEINVKVILEAGKSLQELISLLVSPKEINQKISTDGNASQMISPKLETPIILEENKVDQIVVDEESKNNQYHGSNEFVVNLDILRKSCSIKKNEGKDIKSIFSKYGAEKLSQLKEEDYAAVYEDINSL